MSYAIWYAGSDFGGPDWVGGRDSAATPRERFNNRELAEEYCRVDSVGPPTYNVVESPSQVIACEECHGLPCDCLADGVWGYWYRALAGNNAWAQHTTRLHAVAAQLNHHAYTGPVQRHSEPNPFADIATTITVKGSDKPVRTMISDMVRDLLAPAARASVRSATTATINDEAALAHLLFLTDETVREALAVADDRNMWLRCEREGPYALGSDEMYRRAWLRDEGGRRTWAEKIAAVVFARLRHEREAGGK